LTIVFYVDKQGFLFSGTVSMSGFGQDKQWFITSHKMVPVIVCADFQVITMNHGIRTAIKEAAP
jgi:hypothetical protein